MAQEQTRAGKSSMPIHLFEVRNGVPVRDKTRLQFMNDLDAIAHSKSIAARFRSDIRLSNQALFVVVLNEDGEEIHREQVFPLPR
jgi:hypothetical protein